MYNLFGRFNFLFLGIFLSLPLHAASFAEFKKSQSDFLITYSNEQDKAFHSFLVANWEEYFSKKAEAFYLKPKPNKIASARKNIAKAHGPLVHIKKEYSTDTVKNLDTDSNTSSGVILVKIPQARERKEMEFSFFGTKVGFNIPSGIKQAKFYPQSKKGISNFFNVLISTEYELLIEEINKISFELELNDWAKYILVKQLSERIFSNQDDSRLLEWFIFNKLGYSVRAGLAQKHVIVLYESINVIYNTPIYKIKRKDFYLISNYADGSNESVFTYDKNYPNATRLLDLSMNKLPKFDEELKKKSLVFKQNMKKYKIDFSYNKNMIDFMATYPQADYETFFNAPLEDRSYKDIVNALRKHINGKKSSTAINFVLHFVQNAFKYEVDASQFGREKVMFAQETLYYNKSDCEDRAILFSNLIKSMFNIGVVGVKYSDHMATALYVPILGDTVKVRTKKYVIADPTYINASVGQSMRKYKLKRPKKFIFLR